MGFSIEQTVKQSALVGRGGARPVVLDTTRRQPVATEQVAAPQATKALANRRADARGLVAKVDTVA